MIESPETTSGECEESSKPIWIPPNTEVTRVSYNAHLFTPPSGYLYCGIDNMGNIFSKQEGMMYVCCDCPSGTSGTGCGQDKYGNCTDVCVGNEGVTGITAGADYGCTSNGSIIERGSGGNNTSILILSGGYINILEGIHFESKGREFLPLIFEAMTKNPYVEQAYAAFLKVIYNGMNPSEMLKTDSKNFVAKNGYSMVVVNVFGRGVAIPIPVKYIRDTMIIGNSSGCSHCGQNPPGTSCDDIKNGGCTSGCSPCCNNVIDRNGNLIYSMSNYVY